MCESEPAALGDDELKHIFVKFCLETGHRQMHCNLTKASSRFINIDRMSESGETSRWMRI